MRRWTGLGFNRVTEPMMIYCQLGHCEQTSVKFGSKYKTYPIIENAFDNVVCKISAILFKREFDNFLRDFLHWIIETGMPPKWRNYRHCLNRKLPFDNFRCKVQSMKFSSKWRDFRFRERQGLGTLCDPKHGGNAGTWIRYQGWF